MCNWDIELDGVIDTYKQQILDGIEIMQRDFCILKDIPIRISTQWNCQDNPSTIKIEKYNKTYRHVIYLSQNFLKQEYGLSTLINQNPNRFMRNFSSVIIHELGHVLQDIYCNKRMLSCKSVVPNKYYYEYLRNSCFERLYLKIIKCNIFRIFKIQKAQCEFYLGDNSTTNIYEFFGECFNTYYYLLGEDTASRNGTREYYAFKISEYVINKIRDALKDFCTTRDIL